MEDIEILDPVENWEKELPVQVELGRTRVPVQTIIINNEQKVMYADAFCLVCPKCNTVIKQFEPGVPAIEIIKAINSADSELLNKTLYCSKCGQKLKVFRPIPVEENYESSETTK